MQFVQDSKNEKMLIVIKLGVESGRIILMKVLNWEQLFIIVVFFRLNGIDLKKFYSSYIVSGSEIVR